MPARIAVLLVLSLSAPLRAGTLKGVIVANELGGTPVSAVTVRADGANTTETVGGRFTLQFPQKQPGEPVVLIVDKPGYVIVNHEQLRVFLPKDPDAEILTLLLCKEQEREEWALRFH